MHSKIVVLIALVLVLAAGCSDEGPMIPRTDSGDVEVPEVALQASQTPVQGTITITGLLDPGETFFSDGTTHIRGLVASVSLSGDITGDGIFVQGANINKHGGGPAYGRISIDAEWQNRVGTLSGQFAGRGHGGIAMYTFVLHGTGELDGVKWIASIEGPGGGPFTYGGHIVEP